MTVFSPIPTIKEPPFEIEGKEITAPAACLRAADADEEARARGAAFAAEVKERRFSDFEKEGDRMVHVSTFAEIDGMVYMTYYANTRAAEEDPNNQTARLAVCPVGDPTQKTFFDVQSVGDLCGGQTVSLVYDTIFARRDADTLYILWTAKVGETYYRLYRPYSISRRTLGEVGVNRLKIGNSLHDFSTAGILAGLSENGLGCKRMYSDIGIMQKFTTRVENGTRYYYTGAYSGDMNFLIKSADLITWEYVSQPSFPNWSKWENAVYLLGDTCYYFVRQQDETRYGFLTAYDLRSGTWATPVLIEDCQSRSDFIFYQGQLYLFHAPVDREHIGVVRVDREDLTKSRIILQADMQGSCFYPFVQEFGESFGISYTVARQHIRLARFDPKKYLV